MPAKPDCTVGDVSPLAPAEFEQIRQLAHRTFGLDLKPGKEELVSARLRKLVRAGGHGSFQTYYRSVLEDRSGGSLLAMIDALATNHTSFLREPDHFDFLRREVLPQLTNRDTIEVWTAACSTGEEVWTLAMLLNEASGPQKIRIHASDISNKALTAAQAASYPRERCAGIPAQWLSRYFTPERPPSTNFRISPALRSQAAFRRINLVEPYSWNHAFPIIFCRNVMIYFDRNTQEKVVSRISEYLEPGGYLFVGHAESLTRIQHKLDYVKPAIYRKPGKDKRWNKS